MRPVPTSASKIDFRKGKSVSGFGIIWPDKPLHWAMATLREAADKFLTGLPRCQAKTRIRQVLIWCGGEGAAETSWTELPSFFLPFFPATSAVVSSAAACMRCKI